jgi:hypothetical protein
MYTKMYKEFEFEDEDKRPFSFEDLQGRSDPKRWGPVYRRPVKTKRPVNDEASIPTNCASGQKHDFDAAKHRAKMLAELHALAQQEKTEWAIGKAKGKLVGTNGLTIGQVYVRAMKRKSNV